MGLFSALGQTNEAEDGQQVGDRRQQMERRQADADGLPEITEAYGLRNINAAVLHVNQQLAAGYDGRGEDHGTSATAAGASATAAGASSGGHG